MSHTISRRWIGIAALLWAAPLSACGTTGGAHLTVSQATDVGAGSDHKTHVAPGNFVGITIRIANSGTGPARGVLVADSLPSGFQFYELTTIGGDAIRTAIDDPVHGGPLQWGTWTIPAETGGKESALVISFKAQAPLKPGDYLNDVQVQTTSPGALDAGTPAVVTVDPRPSIAVNTATTAGTVSSGGTVTYVVSVTNVGSAVAHGVAVSITLPSGFLYQTTSGIDGNGARIESIDPPGSSLLPLWASWDIPAMAGSTPGLVRITFQARVLPGVTPGLYTVTTGVTGTTDIPSQTVGDAAPVQVGKGTTIPLTTTVRASSPYAARGGTVTYTITVENDSTDAAANVTITDTLPAGLTYASTASITVGGRGASTRLQPPVGTAQPQWGPFSIPGGGFSGSTLVIQFVATIASDAALGGHADTVSGTSSNAQITGGSDPTPLVITAG